MVANRLKASMAGPALLSAALIAAPVPSESAGQKLERLYGKPSAPSKGCRFELDGDKLRVTVPEGVHSFRHSDLGAVGARTAKRVTGDFRAEVTVRVSVPDGAAAVVPRLGAVVAAGLIVRPGQEPGAVHLFGWHADPVRLGRPAKFEPWFHFDDLDPKSEHGGMKNLDPSVGPSAVRLALTRRGQTVEPSGRGAGGEADLWWTMDGIEWPRMPETVDVGVVVEHWLDKPVQVVFEDFTVAPPPDP